MTVTVVTSDKPPTTVTRKVVPVVVKSKRNVVNFGNEFPSKSPIPVEVVGDRFFDSYSGS